MKKSILMIVTLLLSVSNYCNSTDAKKIYGGAIKVKGTQFVDSFGRQVIFSGVNYVNKNSKENYCFKDSSDVYQQLNQFGINCLRLGLIWDGVEPQPGKYDENYLDKMERKVKLASEKGIYVMLDMHQDLYGSKFSDGAPLWATLDENLPHQTGQIWSDAYLMSAGVQKSFDNFWDNKPASDGMGIQDHYIKMWQQVVKRLAKYDNVIGYDMMNEPFNGSDANAIMPLILKEYATMLAEETGKAPLSEEELMMIWANEKSRLEVLKKLTKADKFARILDAAYQTNKQFESTKLQPMFQKLRDAIRCIDTKGIVFMEHSYFSNPGIRTGLEPLKDKNGKADTQQAYAAHGYDLLVDTDETDSPNNERVELIFSRINETSKRMNMPVLVGEWGAFYSNEKNNSTAAARHTIGLFEKFQFGNTYWSYESELPNLRYFKEALVRPYPQFIAGTLASYAMNYTTNTFTCTWNEKASIAAPTVIYIPDLRKLTKENIKLSETKNKLSIQPIENSKAAYLIIPSSGKSIKRSVNFKLEK